MIVDCVQMQIIDDLFFLFIFKQRGYGECMRAKKESFQNTNYERKIIKIKMNNCNLYSSKQAIRYDIG